jgi:GTP-binding protein
MNKNLPLIVIFGRTNVGKSTLFNCLTEKHQALVSDIEGTTRDANLNKIEWCGNTFDLVDTGGIMDLKYLTGKNIKTGDIEIKVQQQAREFLKRADLILFVVDNKSGLLPHDRLMGDFLKKKKDLAAKTLVVANKVDSHTRDFPNASEFNKLGLGEPVCISAANGSGTGDLLDEIVKKMSTISGGNIPAEAEEEFETEVELKNDQKNLRVAIVGKPNVGKSSLLNAILGYERVIVSPIPHTTREPQNTEIEYADHNITLIDTAGISRHGHKGKGLEKFGIEKSVRALRRADITLLVIDISEPITHQDLKIAEEIIAARKSIIIVANKWDKIKNKDTKKYTEIIRERFPFADYAPIQFLSAQTKLKVNRILDLVITMNESRYIEIGDSILSHFLSKLIKIHRPPKCSGERYPRVYELKQTGVNPPRFQVQIGANDSLDNSYLRFIENRLREKFSFLGSPLVISVIRGKKVHGVAEPTLENIKTKKH